MSKGFNFGAHTPVCGNSVFTIAVALWLSNDEGTQDECTRLVRRLNKYESSQAIKDLVMEGAPDLPASIYSDLLQASLQVVDWYEVAAQFKDDDDEQDDDDTEQSDYV